MYEKDINACHRSNDGTTLVTGDDLGLVKLFSFPCPVPRDTADFHKYLGHSAHVTNVTFSKNINGPSYVVSIGGEDKSVF